MANFKSQILDMVESHVVMTSLFNSFYQFEVKETDKYIEVQNHKSEYMKIWFSEPIVISFGNYTWRKTPPKKYGLIVGSNIDRSISPWLYSNQRPICKFKKFDEFKSFFERYVM